MLNIILILKDVDRIGLINSNHNNNVKANFKTRNKVLPISSRNKNKLLFWKKIGPP